MLAFIVQNMMTPFFQVDIEGWENLDQTKTPSAVMVANHQSAIDSLIFGYLWRHNFKVRARLPSAPRRRGGAPWRCAVGVAAVPLRCVPPSPRREPPSPRRVPPCRAAPGEC